MHSVNIKSYCYSWMIHASNVWVLEEIHGQQIEGTKVKIQYTQFQKQIHTYRQIFHSLFKSKGDKMSWQTFPSSYCYFSIDGKDIWMAPLDIRKEWSWNRSQQTFSKDEGVGVCMRNQGLSHKHITVGVCTRTAFVRGV